MAPPAAVVKLNAASILREAEAARRLDELATVMQEEPLEEARRIAELAAQTAAQAELVSRRRLEAHQSEEALARLREEAKQRNAALVAAVRAERKATLDRLHQQREAAETEARYAREQAEAERDQVRLAVQRVASERRARAQELALEEAALSESLAEQRTLEATQRAQAVKSLFARRLLRQEERHAELRTSHCVSLGTLSTSSSGEGGKVATQAALEKQSQDAAAAEVQKRAAITAERQRKETQLLAKAQELKRRRDDAARRNAERRQAIQDATAAAAAAHTQRREAGSAETTTRLLAKRDNQAEELSRLRAELNTAAGVRRQLADSAADMETRRLADLLLSEQTLAARKQVQAAAEQEAAAKQRERQAQAQLAHAALAFEAKRSMAERYERDMDARRQEASQAQLVEQQRKRDLVLAARQHAAQVRDQRKRVSAAVH